VLWVGVGPHLSGDFVKLDLAALLAPDHDVAKDTAPEVLAEDPVLRDGRYDAVIAERARAGGGARP
jgi:hypothetical protein